MECTVEVCDRNVASSKCNRAAAVCFNDATDVSDSASIADKDDTKKRYMCDGLCGVGKEDECSVDDDDIVSCRACKCGHGTAAMGLNCPVDDMEKCESCQSGSELRSGYPINGKIAGFLPWGSPKIGENN